MVNKAEVEYEISQAVADLKKLHQQLQALKVVCFRPAIGASETELKMIEKVDWSIETVAALLDTWENR